jgi:hypothetical protein
MMSARRDWRRCLPIRRSAPCLVARRPSAPSSSYWRSRPDGDLACFPSRGDDVPALHGSSLCRAISLVACGFTLRGRVTLDGRAARLPSRFGPRRARLEELPDVCGVRRSGSFLGQGFDDRSSCSRPFLLAHPRRPRLGMSDRRASSLKRRLVLTPATAGYDFLPLAAARPFLAQDKKVVPWLPSTACRPFGVRVDRLRSVASHRGRDGRGPGN